MIPGSNSTARTRRQSVFAQALEQPQVDPLRIGFEPIHARDARLVQALWQSEMQGTRTVRSTSNSRAKSQSPSAAASGRNRLEQ